MKLKRIRIEQLRQFRQPFELANLAPGLNLFTGPNEAGKSTVVRAIRAAFFERHRSSSIKDLIPLDDAAATPTVELDFEIADQNYRLVKIFQKKRCSLHWGTQGLDGEEAERHLAKLLGFDLSDRGASKAEHWGIPGLLWIEQGSGQDVHEAVAHASGHLRRALDQSASEVASSHGDAVLAQVEAERELLLTGAGKPRGVLAETLKDRAELGAQCAEIDLRITSYQQQVDSLATLTAKVAADRDAKPWEVFRLQQADAAKALGAIEEQRRALKADEERREQLGQRIKLVQEKLSRHELDQSNLAARQQALALAEKAAADAVDAGKRGANRQEQADAACQRAVQALTSAQTADLRLTLRQRRDEAEQRGGALGKNLAEAVREATQLSDAQTAALQNEMPQGLIEKLRERHGKLRELQIRRDAATTRIAFDLDVDGVTFSGEPLTGSGQRLIERSATLSIPGVGRITVEPGNTGLADLALEEAPLQSSQQADLQRLGVGLVEDAEARFALLGKAQSDVAQSKKALKALARDGLDALRAELAEQRRRVVEADEKLRALPPADGAATLPLQEAQARHEAALADRAEVAKQAQAAQIESSRAATKVEAARAEHLTLAQALNAPAWQQGREEAQLQLIEMRRDSGALAASVAQRKTGIEAQQPDVLEADVERLGKSAANAEQEFRERENEITRLRDRLEDAGAQSLEEDRAALAVRLEAAERRARELRLRADALSMLRDLLERERRAATQRLQAPLSRHVIRYLKMLFADAQLEIAEDLAPAALLRPGTAGGTTSHSPYDSLSFGAREQIGVISRLAYADLLKEAGQPTLIILDDALVHSDAPRLARMKRVLYDAGQRHQVLLFTCHPDHWLDLGAPPRPIGLGLA
ncbi:MAG: AAA family ATPase [Burkholderiales bacterium]